MKRHALSALGIVFAFLGTILTTHSAHAQQFADSVGWRIYLSVLDSSNLGSRSVAQPGLHVRARFGMPYDTLYGFTDRWFENSAPGDTERDWPPTPPGTDIRLQNPRSPLLSSNQYHLIHPFTDSTQIDTMRIVWNSDGISGGSGAGQVIRWPSPSILKYYADTMKLWYSNAFGVWLNVDMTRESLYVYHIYQDTVQDGSPVPSNNIKLIIVHPKLPPLPPDSVVLLYPANGAANQAGQDTLKWQSVSTFGGFTIMYRVQVATDRTFKSASIVLQDSISATTRPYNLAGGSWYYWRVRAFSPFGDGVYAGTIDSFFVSPVGGVSGDHSSIPRSYILGQNFPNPFNPSTSITYGLPVRTHVRLEILDVLGRVVATIVNGVKEAGTYTVTWDASSRPSGTYFYKLTTGGFTGTKKMLLVR